MTAGGFTDACVGKFMEPSVSDAKSGCASSTAPRFSISLTERPLVEPLMITPGHAARTARKSESLSASSYAGDSSGWRTCRCRMLAPAFTARAASATISPSESGTCGLSARRGTIPVSAALMISRSMIPLASVLGILR